MNFSQRLKEKYLSVKGTKGQSYKVTKVSRKETA